VQAAKWLNVVDWVASETTVSPEYTTGCLQLPSLPRENLLEIFARVVTDLHEYERFR
jgi:hypothetical protein